MEEERLSQRAFGKRLGLSSGHISQLVNGKHGPSHSTLALIAVTFGIREPWLRTGEGPMREADPQPVQTREPTPEECLGRRILTLPARPRTALLTLLEELEKVP